MGTRFRGAETLDTRGALPNMALAGAMVVWTSLAVPVVNILIISPQVPGQFNGRYFHSMAGQAANQKTHYVNKCLTLFPNLEHPVNSLLANPLLGDPQSRARRAPRGRGQVEPGEASTVEPGGSPSNHPAYRRGKCLRLITSTRVENLAPSNRSCPPRTTC